MKKNDLSGRVFSRLTVIEDAKIRNPSQKVIYKCLCSCGTVCYIRGCNLVSGNTESCGCIRREYLAEKSRQMTTHGKSGTYEYERGLDLRKKYGLSFEELEEIYTKQGHNCLICGVNESDLPTKLSIDHCHISGKVRGLLCPPCNFGVGHFKDDPNLLRNAIQYLESNKP